MIISCLSLRVFVMQCNIRSPFPVATYTRDMLHGDVGCFFILMAEMRKWLEVCNGSALLSAGVSTSHTFIHIDMVRKVRKVSAMFYISYSYTSCIV